MLIHWCLSLLWISLFLSGFLSNPSLSLISKWLNNVIDWSIISFVFYSVFSFSVLSPHCCDVICTCPLNTGACTLLYAALTLDAFEISTGGHLLYLFSHFGSNAGPFLSACITTHSIMAEVSKKRFCVQNVFCFLSHYWSSNCLMSHNKSGTHVEGVGYSIWMWLVNGIFR